MTSKQFYSWARTLFNEASELGPIQIKKSLAFALEHAYMKGQLDAERRLKDKILK